MIKKTFLVLAILSSCMLALFGCGSSPTTDTSEVPPLNDQDRPSYLSIIPDEAVITVEAKTVFKVIGFRDSQGSPVDAVWSVVSGVGAIDSHSGEYSSSQAGTAEIMASYQGLTKTAEINIMEADTTPPSISMFFDDAELDFSKWFNSGFTMSGARFKSGGHSFYSGKGNDLNNYMTIASPLTASEELTLSFWCYYDTEAGYDKLYIETSTDNVSWTVLKTYDGSSGGWKEEILTIARVSTGRIYVRFRYHTDFSDILNGCYIDDIKINEKD